MKKIKIHIRNNHWKEGFLPCDPEGEKHSAITSAPSLLTCLIIEPPREPVPTTTTLKPSIGLLSKVTNSLFFWFVTIFVI